MAGGQSFIPSTFDPYDQQTNPAVLSYYQTEASLQRGRARLAEITSGPSGTLGVARQNVMNLVHPIGSSVAGFHGMVAGGYNAYQGPASPGNYMSVPTQLGGFLGFGYFEQSRRANETAGMARESALQSLNIGMQDAGRRALTDTIPSTLAMAAFMYGGPVGVIAGSALMAGTLAAPAIMRYTGMDARMSSERTRRQIQLTVGDRLGNRGGLDRFRTSRETAGRLEGEATNYFADLQKEYGWMAPDVETLRPLLTAAINTSTDAELQSMIKKGAGGLKKKMQVLREAAATLNMEFEEIGQLAQQFGQGDAASGVGGDFSQFVSDLDSAATRAPGLNRRALAQQMLQARDTALQSGLSGYQAQRGVAALSADMQQMALSGNLRRDSLYAFGGRTSSEAAMNFAAATMGMQGALVDTSWGKMSMARQMNNLTPSMGLMSSAGNLGSVFAADPFKFMWESADPTARSRAGREAPYTIYNSMASIAGGDPNMRRVLTAQQLSRSTGISMPQARAQVERMEAEMGMLKGFSSSSGVTQDNSMKAFLNMQAYDPAMTVGQFIDRGFTADMVNAAARGDASSALVTSEKFDIGGAYITDKQIEKRARGERRRVRGKAADAVMSNMWGIGIFGPLSPLIHGGGQQVESWFGAGDLGVEAYKAYEETSSGLKATREQELRKMSVFSGVENMLTNNAEQLQRMGILRGGEGGTRGAQLSVNAVFGARSVLGMSRPGSDVQKQIFENAISAATPEEAAALKNMFGTMDVQYNKNNVATVVGLDSNKVADYLKTANKFGNAGAALAALNAQLKYAGEEGVIAKGIQITDVNSISDDQKKAIDLALKAEGGTRALSAMLMPYIQKKMELDKQTNQERAFENLANPKGMLVRTADGT